ncbi:MAG: dockerin type I repeat-containing protein [Candidatus Shapirobacteria bacterium]|nr:dockerin type I repeat-containing protein [Candidatus Shapirobacteria bacterium]
MNVRVRFRQILILAVMVVLAIALPVSTKLVQQNQENRSQAVMVSGNSGSDVGGIVIGTGTCKVKYGNDYRCIPALGRGIECKGSASDCLGSGESCCRSPSCPSLYSDGYSCNETGNCKSASAIIATGCGSLNCCKSINSSLALCTSYTTGSWGSCVNGKQTRKVTGVPSGCSGGDKPASSRSCTPISTKWKVTADSCNTTTGNYTCTSGTDSSFTFADEASCIASDGCDVVLATTKWKVTADSCNTTTGNYTCTSGTDSSFTFADEASCVASDGCDLVTQSSGNSKLSFRVAFAGVTPNATCLNKFQSVKVLIGKVGTNVTEELTTDLKIIDGVKNNGLQVYETANVLDLDESKFGGAGSNNFVKVKGILHGRMAFCSDGQSNKTSVLDGCNISLNGSVYNFSGYPIIAGDVNQDGGVNSIDFSYIKANLSTDEELDAASNGEIDCGNDGDLNGDGVVNNLDLNLVKSSLSYKDDEN